MPLPTENESLTIELDNPRLWWPAGYGGQELYDLSVTLIQDSQELDRHSSKFGLRRLGLIREKDELGESFRLAVNNVPVFCKGANWIPADSFLARVGIEKMANSCRWPEMPA